MSARDIIMGYEQMHESLATTLATMQEFMRGLTETAGQLVAIAEGQVELGEVDVEAYCADVRGWLLEVNPLIARMDGLIATLRHEDEDE